jgi:hypothetical protein
MNPILRRIKRCCIQGRVRFTRKAQDEMLADHLYDHQTLSNL